MLLKSCGISPTAGFNRGEAFSPVRCSTPDPFPLGFQIRDGLAESLPPPLVFVSRSAAIYIQAQRQGRCGPGNGVHLV